ncbi:MAG TPA: hypothetical protein VMZ01_00730 [Aestuariivirga sp.]|nr:hypothetical protein [Aestuariivirga sp.]
MQDLIETIANRTGLDTAKAEQALGTMLGLVKSNGDKTKALELLAKLPGAAELAAEYGGGRFTSGPLATLSKLTAAGLSMEQIKQVGLLTLDYAKDKAGNELVREAAGSIPGLSGYL